MTAEEIEKRAKQGDEPSSDLSKYLQALWLERSGEWGRAHEIVQDLPDLNAAWIHAYLHRQEGDDWNAGYWYRRAKREFPTISLSEEWRLITTTLLEEG